MVVSRGQPEYIFGFHVTHAENACTRVSYSRNSFKKKYMYMNSESPVNSVVSGHDSKTINVTCKYYLMPCGFSTDVAPLCFCTNRLGKSHVKASAPRPHFARLQENTRWTFPEANKTMKFTSTSTTGCTNVERRNTRTCFSPCPFFVDYGSSQVVNVTSSDGRKRRFLWTLERQRRPPDTGKWLIYGVVSSDVDGALTMEG